MIKDEAKVLKVSKDTWQELKKYGLFGDTVDDVVQRVLKICKENLNLKEINK